MSGLLRERDRQVDAACNEGCGFHVWYGPMGLATAREAYVLAAQHVRATGHQVEVIASTTTIITAEAR